MKEITPTQEQMDIFKAFEENRVLKVNACAGSGKSSTLRMLAERNKKSSLYLCFNKVIATEAQEKFPEHVDCKTTHKIAYAKYGAILAHKLKRPQGGSYVNVAGTPSEIAIYYRIQPIKLEDSEITANAVASFVKKVVQRYQNSADEQITKTLLPIADMKDLAKAHKGFDAKVFGDIIIKAAKKLWLDRVDPSSCVLAEHDTYLKLWQLSKPVLDYEILYIDEAQDSNPAVLDVIQRQVHCKICYVGDTYQSIYAFRQAVNAMETINAPTKVLSKSFRFGQSIADAATLVIDYAIMIQGHSEISSAVRDVTDKKYTKLFRTNSALLQEAVTLLDQGEKVYCDVDTKDFCKKLESAENLYQGQLKSVKHQDITPYSDWFDFSVACEEDMELRRVKKIVEKGLTSFYISSLKRLEEKTSNWDIFLTTAHKSKGKEWDNVIIAEDFPTDKIFTLQRKNDLFTQQEANLFYVAVTRASKVLQLPSGLGVICEDEGE